MFHLITHAFFKALLFMGAGVVIHALRDEQDIRKMGGMQKWLPRTARLHVDRHARAGRRVPLSGGISKDTILAAGLELGGFWVVPRVHRRRRRRPADRPVRLAADVRRVPRRAVASTPPSTRRTTPSTARVRRTMLIPVYILTVLAAVAGLLQFPGVTHAFYSWLEPIVYGGVPMLVPPTPTTGSPPASPLRAGVTGILVASRIWGRGRRTTRVAFPRSLAVICERRFFWDELYTSSSTCRPPGRRTPCSRRSRPTSSLGARRARLAGESRFGRTFAAVQTGLVRIYALAFALGVGVLVFYFMVQAA